MNSRKFAGRKGEASLQAGYHNEQSRLEQKVRGIRFEVAVVSVTGRLSHAFRYFENRFNRSLTEEG